MRSLYEINKDYLEALESAFYVDEETGEIVMTQDVLNQLNDEFNTKIDNIVCYIKDLDNLSEGIRNEKKALEERLKANETKIDNLKNYVANALQLRSMDKLETSRNKLSFRTSKSVEIVNESDIAGDYWKEELVKKLDKKAILEKLKSGQVVKGCYLLEKANLQIK